MRITQRNCAGSRARAGRRSSSGGSATFPLSSVTGSLADLKYLFFGPPRCPIPRCANWVTAVRVPGHPRVEHSWPACPGSWDVSGPRGPPGSGIYKLGAVTVVQNVIGRIFWLLIITQFLYYYFGTLLSQWCSLLQRSM